MLGIARSEHHGASAGALGPAAAGLLLLAAFVAVERRARAPMIRLAMLRHRPLAGANVAAAANAGGFSGLMFVTTLYMQQVLGFSALDAGLAFIPLALSAGAGGLLAPRIVDRVGPARTAAASQLLTAAAFVSLARVPEHDGYVTVLLPAFLVAGFTFATAYVATTSEAMTGVREGERGMASGVFQTSNHLGGAIVLAVLATVAAARSGAALETGASTAEALTAGFAVAFLIAAGILVIAGVAAGRTLQRVE